MFLGIWFWKGVKRYREETSYVKLYDKCVPIKALTTFFLLNNEEGCKIELKIDPNDYLELKRYWYWKLIKDPYRWNKNF